MMVKGLVVAGVIVVGVDAAQAQTTLTFRQQMPNITVGVSPAAVATGDFDGDGKMDMAVANSDSDDVSILLGNGDGTFTDVGTTFAVDFSPVAIAVGDLNHDGKPDIVTSNDLGMVLRCVGGPTPSMRCTADVDCGMDGLCKPSSVNDVSVLLNQGRTCIGGSSVGNACTKDGDCPGSTCGSLSFAPPMPMPGVTVRDTEVGNCPEAVVVADLDGDTIPDVATADNCDDTVTVLKGVGDGTFTMPQSISVGSEPMGLATGFIDGDQHLDIVVANMTGGDGGGGTLTVIQGMGGGVFNTQPEIPIDCGVPDDCLPVAVAIAKLDGDNVADLAVLNLDGSNVTVFLGNGDLTFRIGSSFPAATDPESSTAIAAADFDGDGKTDIATSSVSDNKISVLLGIGDGTFGPSQDFDVIGETDLVSPMGIVAADFNMDNHPDLAAASIDDGTVAVFVNTVGLCLGDCSGDGQVTVDELVTLASIALGTAPISACQSGLQTSEMPITVDVIVKAVSNAVSGCKP